MWNYSLKLIYRLVELAFTKILFDSFINSALSLFIKSFQWKSSNARIQASKSKRHEPVTDTHFRIFSSTEQFKGKNSPYWDRVFNLELPWRHVKAKQLGNFQVWAWVVLPWKAVHSATSNKFNDINGNRKDDAVLRDLNAKPISFEPPKSPELDIPEQLHAKRYRRNRIWRSF